MSSTSARTRTMATAAPLMVVGVLIWVTSVAIGSAADSDSPDILVLRGGQTLKGAVLDQTFSLRTSYGQLKLERSAVAIIDLAGDEHGLHTLVTANSNRLTGFIEANTVAFQPQGGSRSEIRREKISEIRLGTQPRPTAEQGTATWIRLKNGDVLSGRVFPDPLPLLITNSAVDISLKELSSLIVDTNRTGRGRLLLRNGTALEAGLAVDYVRIQLDAGPGVELYSEIIAAVGESPALVAVSGSRSPAGPAGVLGWPKGLMAANSTNLEGFVWIAPGKFLMGSPYNEAGRDPDEGPQCQVVIAQGFWIATHEVRQAEYEQVTGNNPSNSNEDPNLPVEKVNWFEAMDYCAKLTRLAETAGWLPKGYGFRLPTEAEWEYCCRAGSTTPFSCGEDGSELQLGQYAWFTRNSEFGSKPVGTRKPNSWGLYDVHGNVWEWCLDRWEGSARGSTVTNTPSPATGGLRVARGGSWLYDAKACRSANRDDYSPANRCGDIGLRVVLAPR